MTDLAPTYRMSDSEEPSLPTPLPEPAASEIRLERVMGVLADPLRLTIVNRLLTSSEEYDHTCGWFGFDRPKSSLTHHFKALREAGVIRQRQHGSSDEAESASKTSMSAFPASWNSLRTGSRPMAKQCE